MAPSREDGVVRAASEVAGGPAGDRVAPGPTRWGAGPVLALGAAVTVAVALLTRQHCRATAWASPGEYVHACYSDVPAVVASHGAAGQVPGTAVLLRLLSVVAPTPRGAFDASVLLAAAALVAAVLCTVRLAGARRWDAALVALSPVVVTSGLVSVDLVAVALLAGALLAWSRRRPVAAGVLLGAAASVRPAVALVLVAVWLVVLVRAPGSATGPADDGADGDGLEDDAAGTADDGVRPHPGAVAAALATVGAVAAAGVATLASRVGTAQQPGGSSWLAGTHGAGYGAVWLLPSLAGRALPAAAVGALSRAALAAVLLAGGATAVRTARRDPGGRPHLAAVALVLVAGALAVSPAVPVQATLVVLPLAALAAPRWRDHLPWAATEVAYATGTWLYVAAQQTTDHRGAPPWLYAALLVLRLAALAWLAAAGVRTAGRPGRPVRPAPDTSGVPTGASTAPSPADGRPWGRAERADPASR